MKTIPDPPEVAQARQLVRDYRADPVASISDVDDAVELLEVLLLELAARGDAIAWMRGGWQPARDEGGRRWTRSARRDGRTLNEKMEPGTQEVMYR